ncbi:MAG TPA: LacI family DNA-binding transcriptional regulator [Rubrobacter sp.]|nr:LacI family DNA-binding transcriptional regulator [Rubrobacter sp.]
MTRVAEELGVSSMTISNAYNRPERVSETLREQIFETAERLGYAGPDPVARSLRRQKTNLAGVLYSNPLSYAFDDAAQVLFLKGVAAATEEAGMGLVLVPGSVGSSPDERASAVMDAAVDGFVVYSIADDDPLVEAAQRRRLPTVIADQPLLEDVPFVGIDNESAAREVARHLVDLGHEKFGVVSFSIAAADRAPGIADSRRQRSATLRVTRARLAGYEAVLEAAGLPWKDVPVYECFGSSKALGREAADALLSQDPPLTAILALSDQLALGVIEAAKERGLSVPEDLSVAGFDDVPEAATSRPPLTTVHQDHTKKGELAGRLLVAQLREEETEDTELLAARLVVRGSTGRPPGAS